MHFEIDYEGVPEEAKKVKALNDIRLFLGDEHFHEMVTECRKVKRQPVVIFAVCGIQGLPARVLQEYVWGPKP